MNDLHGHLEPVRVREPGGRRRQLGGAAVLAAHLDKAAAQAPGRTIRVHAGDMVGASPLISSRFHDEPTVEAINHMHVDLGTLGNHDFDEGPSEMRRLLRGGKRAGGDPHFPGSSFPYISANVVDRRGHLLLPPYWVVERAGARVGFIGVATPTAPRYLLPRRRAGLRFLDISDAVNRWVPVLRRRGVRAIVVLAHSGAVQYAPDRARGEIVDEARQMSDEVDAVVAAHTHTRLNLRVPNRSGHGDKLIVQAFSFGIAYDRLRLTIDRRSDQVVAKSGRVVRTWDDEVRPDPRVAALVAGYARRVWRLSHAVLGRARAPLVPSPPAGSPAPSLGAIMARAQRRLARADIAVVNPGDMRADVPVGPITYADLFSVAAYEFPVERLKLRGRDIARLLDEQFSGPQRLRLFVAGMHAGGEGQRIVLDDGRPLRTDAVYTVAANELLTSGDRFPVLRERGRQKRRVGTDLQALVRYVRASRRPLG